MLNYNIPLPEKVSDILEREFWVFDNVTISMLRAVCDPVKFSAASSIYVRKGECEADIDLQTYHIKAPALVNIRSSQILLPKNASDDFNAGFVVFSKHIIESIYMFITSTPAFSAIYYNPVVSMSEDMCPTVERFLQDLKNISDDKENPYQSEAVIHAITTFFFKDAYKFYRQYMQKPLSSQSRISERFLMLVQQNFRRERFLDFYAQKLQITPKHLSRTLKAQTGYSAVEWIEKYVVLEAKVLLRSSNQTIQQIADELHFSTQSFFGKYFKKNTGMSPKEYRNSTGPQ